MLEFRTVAAIVIFSLTYLVIAFPKIPGLRLDRPVGALAGAVLMVVCGVLTFEQAWKAIEAHTIVLLLGMMVLNVFLEEAGFFELAARFVLQQSRSAVHLLVGLAFLSGILSALFLNDTICLMLTPPLLVVLRQAQLPPTPFLLTLAMSSNVGSVMTVTGNPQNMLIGNYSGISYVEFLLWMAPVGLISLGALTVILILVYRGELRRNPIGRESEGMPMPPVDLDRPLLAKSLIVLAGVLVGFAACRDLALVAISGATLLIIWSRHSPTAVLGRVNWVLLLFFAGLFIVVEGLEQTGVVKETAAVLQPLYGSNPAMQVPVFSAVTVVASNVVSNVPFVILARDMIPGFAHPALMWLILAMASTFAGNLTIPGSMATLIVLEAARPDGHVSFVEFLRVGVVMTVVTVALGAACLVLEHWFW
jgi:Na+/H+ antiporter NhaD/arsenite permease-like protein